MKSGQKLMRNRAHKQKQQSSPSTRYDKLYKTDQISKIQQNLRLMKNQADQFLKRGNKQLPPVIKARHYLYLNYLNQSVDIDQLIGQSKKNSQDQQLTRANCTLSPLRGAYSRNRKHISQIVQNVTQRETNTKINPQNQITNMKVSINLSPLRKVLKTKQISFTLKSLNLNNPRQNQNSKITNISQGSNRTNLAQTHKISGKMVKNLHLEEEFLPKNGHLYNYDSLDLSKGKQTIQNPNILQDVKLNKIDSNKQIKINGQKLNFSLQNIQSSQNNTLKKDSSKNKFQQQEKNDQHMRSTMKSLLKSAMPHCKQVNIRFQPSKSIIFYNQQEDIQKSSRLAKKNDDHLKSTHKMNQSNINSTNKMNLSNINLTNQMNETNVNIKKIKNKSKEVSQSTQYQKKWIQELQTQYKKMYQSRYLKENSISQKKKSNNTIQQQKIKKYKSSLNQSSNSTLISRDQKQKKLYKPLINRRLKHSQKSNQKLPIQSGRQSMVNCQPWSNISKVEQQQNLKTFQQTIQS